MTNYQKQCKFNLEVKINGDFEQVFKLPYAISDLTFKSDIVDSKGVLITSFTIIKDIVNNYIILKLTDTQTALFKGLIGLAYDVKQTNASGFDDFIFFGSVQIINTITKQ